MEVEELLNSKKIAFVPSGRDYKVCCLNPEHDDSDPSMRIDRITGIFNCFVCGFKGNIFTFFGEKANRLQIKRELLKRKLHKKLAESVGLEIPKNHVAFTRDWRGISGQTYSEFEAFEHNDNDFVGRVVFPIRGISGKILGFNGRALTPEKAPKYLITPGDSSFPLFPARVKPVNGSVVLVEGIFDMLNLYDRGLKNVTCTFGTNTLQKDTALKLLPLRTQGITHIYILFDGDKAGREGAEKIKPLIEEQEFIVEIIQVPEGMDPGSMDQEYVDSINEYVNKQATQP